jgi:hypothetical protein
MESREWEVRNQWKEVGKSRRKSDEVVEGPGMSEWQGE